MLLRKSVMLLTALVGAFAMLYMQARFDKGDQQAAITIARNYRSPSGKSLTDAIATENPGSAPEWSAHTESSCFGHERVRANVPRESGAAAYDFLVDINGPSIHPGNTAGQRMLEQIGP